MDISSLAGASGGVLIIFAVLKLGEYIRDIMIKREGKQVEQRAVRVDDETKVIKLNGTKCDGHNALLAKIEGVIELKEDVKDVKADIKELSQKLDTFVEKVFDRVREVEKSVGNVEKDVAVLQAKG
jgi:hypothetical protein